MIYRTVRDDERVNGLPMDALPFFTTPSGEPEWAVPVVVDHRLTVDEDGEFRFDGSLRNKNLMMADPGEYIVVRVGDTQ